MDIHHTISTVLLHHTSICCNINPVLLNSIYIIIYTVFSIIYTVLLQYLHPFVVYYTPLFRCIISTPYCCIDHIHRFVAFYTPFCCTILYYKPVCFFASYRHHTVLSYHLHNFLHRSYTLF